MPALIACLQNDFKLQPSTKSGKPTCLFHNCVQFKLPGGKPGSLTLIDSTKFLEVHVRTKKAVDPHLLHRIRQSILAALEAVHKSLHYRPPNTEIGFICPGKECEVEELHLATVDSEKRMWTCSMDDEVGDELDDIQKYWVGSRPSHLSLGLLLSIGAGEGKEIRIIDSVTSQWEILGIALGFGGEIIEIIKKDHPSDCSGACLDMFRCWIQGKARTPSWDTLLQALKEVKFVELASKLEQILK